VLLEREEEKWSEGLSVWVGIGVEVGTSVEDVACILFFIKISLVNLGLFFGMLILLF